MSQPISGDQFVRVVAAGTTITSNGPTNLKRVLVSGTFIGSAEWYDTATAAGTAAGNLIYTIGLPGLNQNQSIEVHSRVRTGLTCVATGTPILTYTWGD